MRRRRQLRRLLLRLRLRLLLLLGGLFGQLPVEAGQPDLQRVGRQAALSRPALVGAQLPVHVDLRGAGGGVERTEVKLGIEPGAHDDPIGGGGGEWITKWMTETVPTRSAIGEGRG